MPTREELLKQGYSEDVIDLNTEGLGLKSDRVTGQIIHQDTPGDLNAYFGRSNSGGNQSKAHDQLVKDIIDFLRELGFLAVSFRKAYSAKGYRTPITGDTGSPDILAVHPAARLLIFIEVKTGQGVPSKDQYRWHDALRTVAIMRTVWPEYYEGFKKEIKELVEAGKE